MSQPIDEAVSIWNEWEAAFRKENDLELNSSNSFSELPTVSTFESKNFNAENVKTTLVLKAGRCCSSLSFNWFFRGIKWLHDWYYGSNLNISNELRKSEPSKFTELVKSKLPTFKNVISENETSLAGKFNHTEKNLGSDNYFRFFNAIWAIDQDLNEDKIGSQFLGILLSPPLADEDYVPRNVWRNGHESIHLPLENINLNNAVNFMSGVSEEGQLLLPTKIITIQDLIEN